MIGEIKYRNFDDDPAITNADRVVIGDTNPDYVYGLSLIHICIYTDEYGNATKVGVADWQDLIYQDGFSQEYNISVSGEMCIRDRSL